LNREIFFVTKNQFPNYDVRNVNLVILNYSYFNLRLALFGLFLDGSFLRFYIVEFQV
jgi:hypothetical protein